MAATIVWFRRDLRLADNPALTAATKAGEAVIPVYVHAPEEAGDWAPGAASDWWLHHSLCALDKRLAKHRLRLVVRRGPTLAALRNLIEATGAQAVHWNRLYDPALTARDREVKLELRRQGIRAESHQAHLLYEPWTVQTGSGGAYQAFAPFWRACRRLGDPDQPLAEPSLRIPETLPDGSAIDSLGLLPRIPWDTGLRETWQPGEAGAEAMLARFVHKRLSGYPKNRERPATAGTSQLSPHLHFGEISPRQIWHKVQRHISESNTAGLDDGADKFLAELGWREFAHHVLFHNPRFPDEPLNPRFADFPWRDDAEPLLRAWRRGETGFPIVDAGMHELWETGWMHNRVRMIVGSLLVKNLRGPWQWGERWFWDTLVDADLANNSLGWQWVAGSGADAAPFFRIFNPVRQGERFDAEGDYVARWVPELARLPAQHRQAPWQAPADERRRAGVSLDENYPNPIVDLKETRREALAAFEQIKRSAQ